MPPVLARRLVIIPLWMMLAVVGTLGSPVALAIAALAGALTGSRQPVRLVHFTLSYLLHETAILAACGGLWVASGFGRRMTSERFQAAHYRLMGRLLEGILQDVLGSLRIDIDAEGSPAAEQALRDPHRPLILFSRHAGPGDSFLIINLLVSRYGRRPRIVMKKALALDPCLDLLCHRLPNALLDTTDREACEAQITIMAEGLDGRGVLVLFPEGGNFTPERRRRAILSLWRQGRGAQASQAEAMEHVMAPKPTGALTALAANPSADVIFAAHTGLGRDAYPLEMWRHPPVGHTLHMRMWLAPASERPSDGEAQMDWLFGWWKALDDWIDSQGTEPTQENGHR